MYVCIHVCMFVSMYVCLYVCMYVCMHVCMFVCMYVCFYVCLYVCFVCMYVYLFVCLCMFVCTYVCLCVCTGSIARRVCKKKKDGKDGFRGKCGLFCLYMVSRSFCKQLGPLRAFGFVVVLLLCASFIYYITEMGWNTDLLIKGFFFFFPVSFFAFILCLLVMIPLKYPNAS